MDDNKDASEWQDGQREHKPAGEWSGTSTNMQADSAFSHIAQRDGLINATIGNYVLLSLIGSGGFGEVYKAHDKTLNRDVAIKFLKGVPDEARHALFEREARAFAALSKHPNIVAIHQWGEYRDQKYIVLEYVEGSAAQLLKDYPDGLPLATALRIVLQCAEALQEAHRLDILHRDIKPANILIEPSNNQAKITDFGLARLGMTSDSTLGGCISGSPEYMSPEQASMEPLDARSDIFSLGVTLYQLLSGKRPFEGARKDEVIQKVRRHEMTALKEHRPDLPRAVHDMVGKATAFKREDRYQTAGEMAQQVRIALGSLERNGSVAIEPTPEPLLVEVNKPKASTARKLAELAVIITVVMAMMLVFLFALLPDQDIQNLQPGDDVHAAAISLSQRDFAGAADVFREILDKEPESDLVRYGYCLALARLDRMAEASELAAAIDTPDLRAEAQATVAFLSQPDNARNDIASMAEANSTPYLQLLLARLDLLDNNPEQAVQRLNPISEDRFQLPGQYTEALETLGQAQYHLGRYEDALATFQRAAETASGGGSRATGAYLAEIESQLDEPRHAEIRTRAAEIRALMDRAEPTEADADMWTSRPLTFAILPGEAKRSRLALESGLADLLPSLLGGRLAADTPMAMVDRDLIQHILAEQELSGMLGSDRGRLRLGQLLGARLLMKCDFTRIGDTEKAMLTTNDTETTERIHVPVLDIDSPVALDTVSDSLAATIWESVAGRYPVQGRLYAGPDGLAINIGAAAGVVPGMAFDILVDPDAPPIPGARATVQDAPGAASARVAVAGIDAETLGDTPDTGWFIRAERGNAM